MLSRYTNSITFEVSQQPEAFDSLHLFKIGFPFLITPREWLAFAPKDKALPL
jgi:hypothetical protein